MSENRNVKQDVSPEISKPSKVEESGTNTIIDAESVYKYTPASAIKVANVSLFSRAVLNTPANEARIRGMM
jgi:hypothetical protein